MSAGSENPVRLRRVLTFWPLVFYGLGVIVGAGIYVALGLVIERAGSGAPLSFLLAGLVACMTGLCYAELGGRFPEAAGAAAYVKHGFNSNRLSQIVGLSVAFTGIISAASIAHGAVVYLSVVLPVWPSIILTVMLAGFTAISIAGVRQSVFLAATLGILEIGGLAIATAAGLFQAANNPPADIQFMLESLKWPGILSGAFIAFFAFIGFETLANLGEEVREPHKTLPRGILGAVFASIVLYFFVACAAVLTGRGPDSPLIGLFTGKSAVWFALFGGIAIANGVLVQLVMLARLFYGMAVRNMLPSFLAQVSPRTRTPVWACLGSGALALFASLALPFEHLLITANAFTLIIFAAVSMALWNIKRRSPVTGPQLSVPAVIPLASTALCMGLLFAEIWIWSVK